MKQNPVTVNTPCISLFIVALLCFSLIPFSFSSLRRAEASPPTAISPTDGTGSPASLGTVVTSGSSIVPSNLCAADCVITGGTRAGNNLFHSFGDFNIGALDSARFQTGLVNPLPDASVSNILARITGGQSNLFGILDSATYYPSANLFLMNPAGFLFGPNATVNVGGMATFTTADSMRLSDGITNGYFYAGLAVSSLLTSAPVAAFGFIDPIVRPIGTITVYGMTVQGPMPTVPNTGAPLEQKVALVGGNTMFTSDPDSGTPSTVTAPGRQIQITSVAGAGAVAANSLMPETSMGLGTVTLDPGTIISTAGDPLIGNGSGSGGAISIRGGQFVANVAQILTSPVSSSGAGSAGIVSVTANDSLTMTNTFIDTSSQQAGGDAGPVTLTTNGLVSLTDSVIVTAATDSGNGGVVTITGKDVTFDRASVFTIAEVSTPALGEVHSGAVTVTADGTVTLSASSIGDFIINTSALGTLGDAGQVMIIGKTVNLSNGMIDASLHNGNIVSPGNGGAIEIRSNSMNLTQFSLFSLADGVPESTGTGGSILLRGTNSINADNIQLTASQINTSATTGGGAGKIVFQTKTLTVSDQTGIGSSSFGQGPVGTVTVKGAENVTIESGSRVSTEVGVTLPGVLQGAGGSILFETQNLALLSGGHISANALPNSTGNAGNIAVQGNSSNPAQSILIDGAGSGIFTDTQGTGAGGNIFVNANTVTLQNGAGLSSKTTSAGDAGEITITGNTLSLASGSQISSASIGTTATTNPDGTTEAPGTAGSINITGAGGFSSNASTVATSAEANHGGDISITAQSVQLSGSTSITASSNAPLQVTEVVLIDGQLVSQVVGNGNAGNIDINAGNLFAMTNSSVTTEADQASGGSIKITTNPGGTVQLIDSLISASVLNGAGGGGSVNIDPLYVIFQNSQMLAQAVQGPGGNITITITNGGLFLSDAYSVISASSQFGVNGTVTIQSPNAPISGQIQPLGKTPLIATSLLNQHCSSLAGGEFSSFTVAGRDSLPTEPGGWLASPLATLSVGTGLGVKAEGERLKDMSAGAGQVDSGQWRMGDIQILSLRRIAPAGFLTQAFAVEGAASCQS